MAANGFPSLRPPAQDDISNFLQRPPQPVETESLMQPLSITKSPVS